MTFFKNGGTVPLLLTRGIPRLHRDIRFLETSQLPQVQRISGSIFPLSDHTYDPLRRLTRRKDICPERKPEHLNPMGLEIPSHNSEVTHS